MLEKSASDEKKLIIFICINKCAAGRSGVRRK